MKAYKNLFFLGIGGIGMSGLAQYFRKIDRKVGGYDAKPSEITNLMQDQGISITFEDKVSQILPAFLDKENTLIVFTKAIPEYSELFSYFKDQGFDIVKRSQLLGNIAQKSFCFAVAGCNGKTTTTSILTHILKTANVKLTAFVGGVMRNYNTNFISDGPDVIVVEADEYDRSFLYLQPNIACITSMDLDHIEIYPTHQDLVAAFDTFVKQIKSGGQLVAEESLKFKEHTTYGLKGSGDFKINNLKIIESSKLKSQNPSYPKYYQFDVESTEKTIKKVIFPYLGLHNLENALAATAMSLAYGIKPKYIKEALESFKGVERRFNFYKWEDKIVIDDYSHHPEGIQRMYEAVRDMYPEEKILAVFQPHLFSRTQAFADNFAQSLSNFDEVMLLNIYPAREKPIEGVTSAWLLSKIKSLQKQVVYANVLSQSIKESEAKIVLAMGAGDITNIIKRLVFNHEV